MRESDPQTALALVLVTIIFVLGFAGGLVTHNLIYKENKQNELTKLDYDNIIDGLHSDVAALTDSLAYCREINYTMWQKRETTNK